MGETEYGSASLNEQEQFWTGLCFVKLLDFNGDGVEELILAYQTEPSNVDNVEYTVELWEFDGSSAKRVASQISWTGNNIPYEEGHAVAINELKKFIFDFLHPGISVEKCMAIVINIDELVEVKICGKIINGRKIVKYNALNSQYIDQVKILPRFKDAFIDRANKKLGNTIYPFLRATRENECSPVDDQVTNYMIWDAKHIEQYPVWIYHFDNTSLLEKHFDQRDNKTGRVVEGSIKFMTLLYH